MEFADEWVWERFGNPNYGARPLVKNLWIIFERINRLAAAF